MLFSKKLIWAAAITWIVAIAFLIYLVLDPYAKRPAMTLAPMVVYIAALLALAGWMVQTWNTARIGRKQHSMNVLIQTRFSQVHKDHLENISAVFSPGQSFDLATLSAHPKAKRSLVYLLNYYEFIAVALAQGDLDEPIIRDAIRGQLTDVVERSSAYMKDARKEDASGKPAPEKALVYARVLPLAKRWDDYLKQENKKRK